MNRQTALLRFTRQGLHTTLLHCAGKTAVGFAHPGNDPNRKPVYLGRIRNRYAHHATLPGLFAALRAIRHELRAKDGQLISYQEAKHYIEGQPGCIRLFCVLHKLDTRLNYSRRELRRAILSRRCQRSGFYLSMLDRIPFTTN